MADWTLNELMYLTREELCRLASEIEQGLPGYEPGTVERLDALVSLDNIRRVMSMRHFHF